MTKKRITYLDIAKGVGIIWVVMRHSQMMNDTLYNSLASIIMPLFFVVSGMLMQHIGEERKSMKEITVRKAKSLLIPYVTFSISYLLINGVIHLTQPELMSGTQLLKLTIYFVSFAGISVMWFLPTMFVSELYFLALRKRCSHKMTILICAVLGVIAIVIAPVYDEQFWFANMPLLMFSFFLAMLTRSVICGIFLCFGYYIKMLMTEREKIFLPELLLGIVMFGGIMALNVYNGTVDLHYMTFNNPLFYFIGANLGSLGVILICKNIPQLKILSFLGVNSLIIMSTHVDWFILAKVQEWSMLINMHVTRAKVYVLWLCITVFMLVIETALIFIIDQYGYFLLGKKKPRERTWNIVKYLRGKLW
ncbi:MAG: acyltransferase [Lachnospiraceae bacterium]|nr:acyltransferase [Lachnospiraceae bacterium]